MQLYRCTKGVLKMSTVITGINIDIFRLKALRGMLYLETKGMSRTGASAYSIIKRETGLKGSKVKVLAQLDQLLLTVKVEATA